MEASQLEQRLYALERELCTLRDGHNSLKLRTTNLESRQIHTLDQRNGGGQRCSPTPTHRPFVRFRWDSRSNLENYLIDRGFVTWFDLKERFLTRFIKVVVSLLVLALAIFLSAVAMVFTHERVPDMATYKPLPDIVLDNIPLIHWAFDAAETIIFALMSALSIILAFHKHRMVIVRRYALQLGALLLLRCLTMCVTSLSVPSTHLNCNRPITLLSVEEKLERAFAIAFACGSKLRGVETCGDYIFSGHTTVLTLTNLFICDHLPSASAWEGVRIMSWACATFGMFFVLAAHEHYTVDVLLAFFLTRWVYSHYKTMCLIQADARLNANLPAYATVSEFFLFQYFESETSGELPNEFEYPWTGIWHLLQMKSKAPTPVPKRTKKQVSDEDEGSDSPSSKRRLSLKTD